MTVARVRPVDNLPLAGQLDGTELLVGTQQGAAVAVTTQKVADRAAQLVPPISTEVTQALSEKADEASLSPLAVTAAAGNPSVSIPILARNGVGTAGFRDVGVEGGVAVFPIKANGDVRLSDDLKIGRYQGGKFISQVDSLQIQGPGSTGDASKLDAVAGTETYRRQLADRAADAPSLKDYGAPNAGVWDAPMLAAQFRPTRRFVLPEGTYPTSFGRFDAGGKVYAGPGQLSYSDGTKDAPWRTVITEYKPSPTGWSPSPVDQWTADFSQFHTAARSFVTAAANPPQTPTYTNMPMVAMTTFGMEFGGGYNLNPNDHGQGRTGAAMHFDNLRHSGQGDAGVWTFNIAVNSTRAGATHFLANPASSAFGGNIYATSQGEGAYLQGSEIVYSDSGVAVAVIDRTRNYNRTNSGNSLGQIWIHDRPQSSIAVPIDGFYVPGGGAKRGLDLAGADFSKGDQAAIVLAPNQRIYFSGVATPDGSGLTTVSTSLGSAYVTMDNAGYIHINAGAGRTVVIDNLPTSASGLPSNGLYKDVNGFVKAAP